MPSRKTVRDAKNASRRGDDAREATVISINQPSGKFSKCESGILLRKVLSRF
jgi:hypothetical protein